MQVKTLRKAEKPAFVYKMHRNTHEKPPAPPEKKCLFPYLVSGYQQYSQAYPQLLCITFSYSEGYPLASQEKNG